MTSPRLLPILSVVFILAFWIRCLSSDPITCYPAAQIYFTSIPINLCLSALCRSGLLRIVCRESGSVGFNLFSWSFGSLNQQHVNGCGNYNLMIRHRQEAGRGFEALVLTSGKVLVRLIHDERTNHMWEVWASPRLIT